MTAPIDPAGDRTGMPDGAVVERVAAGDTGALTTLFDRYAGPAYALAVRVTGDRRFAEHVVLAAFGDLWHDPLPSRNGVVPWLFAVTHRHAVDAVRREKALAHRRVEAVRDAQRVRQLPGGLPAEHRAVLALAFFGGYTQREVAALTGTPLSTVRVRMLAGLYRLGRLLEVLPADAVAEAGTDHQTEAGLAAGAVLHALEPDEEEWFGGHLPVCPRCRALISTGERVLGVLVAGLPGQDPPELMRHRLVWLLGGGTGDPPGDPPDEPSDGPPAGIPPWRPGQPVGTGADRSYPDESSESTGDLDGTVSLARLRSVMAWMAVAILLVTALASVGWYVAVH